MLAITCDGCHRTAYAECEAAPAGGRACGQDGCAHSDPDAAFDVLQPGCGCCGEDHHHGAAANESGEPCRPLTITVLPGSAGSAANMRHVAGG
jgi:hypothetical protein